MISRSADSMTPTPMRSLEEAIHRDRRQTGAGDRWGGMGSQGVFKVKCSGFTVLLTSVVQQTEATIHVYILFHIFFHCGLSQAFEYSSLCYIVEPCLSILYITICISDPRLPIHPSPSLQNWCLMGTEFQFHKMKRVLEMDGTDVIAV